jgi:hypothetical protein
VAGDRPTQRLGFDTKTSTVRDASARATAATALKPRILRIRGFAFSRRLVDDERIGPPAPAPGANGLSQGPGWQVNSASSGTGTCTAELRIDDIRFQ